MDNNDPQYLFEEHPDLLGGIGFYVMPNSPNTVYVLCGLDIDLMVHRDELILELRDLADRLEK